MIAAWQGVILTGGEDDEFVPLMGPRDVEWK